MRELIKRNINGKRVLFFFFAANAVYAVMLFITIPLLTKFSGGMRLLDMSRGGYDADYVNTLFSALGKEGRDTYLFIQIPVDMIYPFLSGIAYCLVLAYFLDRLGKFNSFLFYVCLLPLVSALFDYSENIGIISMLRSYPNTPSWLAQTTSTFTMLKTSIAM